MSPERTLDALRAEIAIACHRIAPFIRETPLLESPALRALTKERVLLKLENLQYTGSFKLRGATNCLLSLGEEARQGVVAASSGNHGVAVAHAGRVLGLPVTVFVPEGASETKVGAIREARADVQVAGGDGLDTEQHARRVAAASGRPYISPYNDLAVVAGQGTIGAELRRQAERFDAIIVAVGGGGLVGGLAADLKAFLPEVVVIGAVPEASPVMARSVEAGRVIEMPSRPTLSDGTAGGIEPDSITFDLCRTLVDRWVEIPEQEIASAMRHCLLREHVVAEGSAGVAVAALFHTAPVLRNARIVVILCGGNVSPERLGSVLDPSTAVGRSPSGD